MDDQAIEQANTTSVAWPERPTCHDSDWQAERFGPTAWKPKGEKLHPSNDLPQVFRTCSYCGSIHPEDLIEALKAGATLGGADWKYGWPHKFYVEKIPNPYEGEAERETSISIKGDFPTDEERARLSNYSSTGIMQSGFSPVDGKPRFELVGYRFAGATTHGKWYNTHLSDLNPEAFAVLAQMIEQRTGITFAMGDQGRLGYRAPRVGHQA